MPNFEGLPDPRHTPVTPETVAKFDPKIQEILLRNAGKAKAEADKEPLQVTPAPEAPKPKQKQFTTFIEKSLPNDD